MIRTIYGNQLSCYVYIMLQDLFTFYFLQYMIREY